MFCAFRVCGGIAGIGVFFCDACVPEIGLCN